MSTSIRTDQRFTSRHHCPICGGHSQLPQGKGERCYGFLSDDGDWAHCTRPEYAGSLDLHDGSSTYAHKLKGDCKCGTRHDPSLVSTNQAATPHVHWYLIRDEHGTLIAKHKRIDQANGAKECIWYGPDGSIGLDGRRLETLPLYGVHLLKDRPGEPVIVVEGEKAADALIAAGRLAVGTVTGAKVIPSLDVLRPLLGRDLSLWPDNDDDGRQHMAGIASRLTSLGAWPHMITWSDAPPKGDAYDFIQKCGSNGSLDVLIGKATPYNSSTQPSVRRYLTEDEIDDLQPPTWLIKGVVPAGEVTMVIGPGDSGKTFVVVDMAKRVAEHYPVMYVAAEDASGIKIRKRAWELHYRRPKTGNFMMWNGVLALFDGLEIQAFIDEVRALALRMIVIDTLSQSIAGADENSSKDMALVMYHCQQIARETGAAVVIIHHTTKGGEAYRGSSAIKNNTYAFLEVSKDDEVIKFECGRIKNTKPFPARFFQLVTVPTGIRDEEGTEITSCVILPADRVMRGDELSRNEIKMLEHLLNMTDATDGAKTTDLQKVLELAPASFYRSLKRLRALGLADKGDKVSDPLTITSRGRQKLAEVSNDPQHHPTGMPANAAGLFEVNPHLGKLLSSSHDSNSGDSSPESSPQSGVQGGTTISASEAAQSEVITTITELSKPPDSNGQTTIYHSPPLKGRDDESRPESDIHHDRRRQDEINKALAVGGVKAARKAANQIRGRKAQEEAELKIEEYEAAHRSGEASA